ncbi:MAG: hypothetical protein A3G32_02265 [Deltaproteobacteria bacterium RIFCSPLOWO2_12_FULL_40_28]|nr:MAG: hypothetical protein A3C45_02945 [Deltaproteobacteria bacterium RIFCSPHIGHO2_02_FULL_40_28]OGQ20652.1 MAG: hypothetical protein A3E27_10055 [Deltaproteobacteria bacterium RIFCSPHIGHO2_12_FULL_40_32]OGQ38887.1 MAG: hypothetical protein A3I69_08275 [Deltaproteobacteria bacterium RIFCSPLOWO2_02_FULL_40_36]OGQ55246.1 MAG: hypothetical protein A3G32_02265 [Deltaproteobacteria bacterium RIFCSPLOWO2_12_FULL_40_28]
MKIHHIQLSASYDIYASHILKNPKWNAQKNKKVFGHCARLHGHQYRAIVTVAGKINSESGMLINGYDLDALVKKHILEYLDHHHLNEADPFFKTHLPTAEWIAVFIFKKLKNKLPKNCKLTKVRVYETPNLYVDYPN